MTTANALQITVLMSVYNGERFLREAVDSVFAQTHREFEFLIVNDGSTDGSRAIILSYQDPRIRLLDNPANLGLIASLNRGLEEARGEWIFRADADDINDPRRLEIQLAAVLRTNADVCFAETQDCYPDGLRVVDPYHGLSAARRRWLCLFRNAYGAHPAACYRKDRILAVGGYDPHYFGSEDYELWDRCAAAGLAIVNLDQPLVLHRIHPQNVSSRHQQSQIEATSRIRWTALRRIWPELTQHDADTLGWLLKGYSAEKAASPHGNGLRLARPFIGRYLAARASTTERPEIWAAVADSLARRVAKAATHAERLSIFMAWTEAALRAGRAYRWPIREGWRRLTRRR